MLRTADKFHYEKKYWFVQEHFNIKGITATIFGVLWQLIERGFSRCQIDCVKIEKSLVFEPRTERYKESVSSTIPDLIR